MATYLLYRHRREDGGVVRFFDNGYLIIEDLYNDIYICVPLEYDPSKPYSRSDIDRIVDELLDDPNSYMRPYRTYDGVGMISIYENDILHYWNKDVDTIIPIDYEWFMDELNDELSQSYLDDLIAQIHV